MKPVARVHIPPALIYCAGLLFGTAIGRILLALVAALLAYFLLDLALFVLTEKRR